MVRAEIGGGRSGVGGGGKRERGRGEEGLGLERGF